MTVTLDDREAREIRRHLSILSLVEAAHYLGDPKRLEALLAGVDPLECRRLSRLLQDRGGTDDGALTASAAAGTDGSRRPTAPSNVRHLDPWSRRTAPAPCA